MRENQYRLPEKFPRDSVVLDIGAHIGCFAVACLARGAHYLDCYEPEKDNCEFLRKNLAEYGLEHSWVNQVAVWRSDRENGCLHLLNKYPRTAENYLWLDGQEVAGVGLDSILGRFPEIYLLKIDAEGAEYPILHTSKELRRVKNLAVEVHKKSLLDPEFEPDPDVLERHLQHQGFQVERVKNAYCPELLEMFFGSKITIR
jgi:FkbM family methyltransferase